MLPAILVISYHEKLYKALGERLGQQLRVLYLNSKQGVGRCMRPDAVLLCIVEAFRFNKKSAELIKNLRSTLDAPILFISNSKMSEQRVQEKVCAIDSGADEFLASPLAMDEILASVKALIRWQIRMAGTPEILTANGLRIIPDSRQVFVDGNSVRLTKIEFDILYYLAMKGDRTVTYRELYEVIWKHEYWGDDANIMAHIHRLRNKLKRGTHDPSYLQNVYGVGYRFER